MNASMPCPDQTRMQALLAGSLPDSEVELLTAHVAACATCRATLDRLAGLSDSWPDVARCLKEGQTASHPALEQAMEQLRRQSEEETLPPEQAADVPVSEVKLGHYQVQAVVGQGGMGKVYRAFDQTLHRVVAIKVMADSLAASGPARQRFLREARAAGAVVHEHVIVIHEVNESGAVPYLVMQFVSGQSLQDRIDRDGPLPLKDILRIGMQTAAGLAAAHKQGLVHRDIKPANILLENGVERVKITDFGLARAVDDASLTQSGVIAGTPQYMSPEQANGEHIDHRSDLFSLGSVMYAMATGRAPFRASNTMGVLMRVVNDDPRPVREINPDVPGWLEKIIAKLMAKDVKKRYQSADEVAELLGKALAKVQTSDSPGKPRKRFLLPEGEATTTTRKKKRSRLGWWIGGAAALLVAALGLAWGLGGFSSKRPLVEHKDRDGWVQLFNGKDLTGWNTTDGSLAEWSVVNGVLTGRVSRGGYLYSDRGDYQDFHLRVEARINETGGSGVHFRSRISREQGRAPDGYEAQIAGPSADSNQTGSLFRYPGKNWLLNKITMPPIAAGEWFTQEIIAHNGRIIVKVNDQTLTDLEVPSGEPGHLALQLSRGNTVVEFRKIEIKELSPEWVPLFNGKDKKGWKQHPTDAGTWSVEDGALVGRGPTTYLFSERGDYENFHLRAVAKVNATGDSGVWVRSAYQVFPGRVRPHVSINTGYEAEIGVRPNFLAHTGSLTMGQVLQRAPLNPHKPDEWFTLEIIAEGNRIRTLVNGKPAADYRDRTSRFMRGHIALQAWSYEQPRTVVHFRKIEIKKLPPTKTSPVDLLALIDPARHALDPGVRKEDGVLLTPPSNKRNTRVMIPYKPVPAEYDIRLVAERKGWDAFGLNLGFVMGGRQAVLDMDGSKPPRWCVSRIDGKSMHNGNVTTVEGGRFPLNKKVRVDLQVRRSGVKVLCDGQVVIDWKGRPEQLSLWEQIVLPDRESLFFYSQAAFAIHELLLEPVPPFVVLAKAGRAEARHATLEEAVKAAESGDTIEIHGNGPFVSAPIDLGKKPLTIRAAAGTHPVVRLEAASAEGKFVLLSTEAPLVLEGIDLQRFATRNLEEIRDMPWSLRKGQRCTPPIAGSSRTTAASAIAATTRPGSRW